jgi:hypothetical protein
MEETEYREYADDRIEGHVDVGTNRSMIVRYKKDGVSTISLAIKLKKYSISG